MQILIVGKPDRIVQQINKRENHTEDGSGYQWSDSVMARTWRRKMKVLQKTLETACNHMQQRDNTRKQSSGNRPSLSSMPMPSSGNLNQQRTKRVSSVMLLMCPQHRSGCNSVGQCIIGHSNCVSYYMVSCLCLSIQSAAYTSSLLHQELISQHGESLLTNTLVTTCSL